MAHPIVEKLHQQMTLPVICSPMFIVSSPTLVIEQCKSGVIGSMPALNARPSELLDDWLAQISETLDDVRSKEPGRKVAPYAINQIIHASNDRLDNDMQTCAKHKVPMIITSLRAPDDVVKHVHEWGGLVFHDVTTIRHAEKALEAGVDGLILVASGAGGHAGKLSPFAILPEVRKFFDGPIALSGSITNGSSVLAARALGADFAYIGTRFIASHEANADERYKKMIVESSAKDILYTPFFTGIPGNYLIPSIVASGLNPESLTEEEKLATNFGSTRVKPWKDIWGAGQGVGSIDAVESAADIVKNMKREYDAARQRIMAEL
ncbi:nitronate monooxygenase family protein [Advenella alkanexedens]|jgi:nitronate monooxygenase|uniref:Nitronate monooxygenase family protein n=1 Tax=Advenella alkanexedens TaxID=1481665 RepID=A0ABS6NK97_9BURK|nr:MULTISPECIES: nitronate monooxygenase family protein [Advenella]MBV4396053.1 nitronate monooxygenase family protein [Advenella alkanexedens]MDD3759088.1 nitronate monooxygenase family protein [Advenella sp.]NLN69082.1 nitronate monooxygenase [Alcaligenaceae bacterium]